MEGRRKDEKDLDRSSWTGWWRMDTGNSK